MNPQKKVAEDVLAFIEGTALDTEEYRNKLKNLWVSDQMTVAKRDLAELLRREREDRKALKPAKLVLPAKINATSAQLPQTYENLGKRGRSAFKIGMNREHVRLLRRKQPELFNALNDISAPWNLLRDFA